MQSNDHIKENWATIEGGSTPLPSFGETVAPDFHGLHVFVSNCGICALKNFCQVYAYVCACFLNCEVFSEPDA